VAIDAETNEIAATDRKIAVEGLLLWDVPQVRVAS